MLEKLTSPEILMTLGGWLSCYLTFYMHRHFYEYKDWIVEKRDWLLLVYMADWIIVHWLNGLEIPIVNFVGNLLSYIVPLFLCYKVKGFKEFVYYFYYMATMMAVEAVLAASCGALNNGMSGTRYDVITPITAAILNFSELISVILICRFAHRGKKEKYDNVALGFMVLPIISLGLIVYEYIVVSTGVEKNFNMSQFIQMAISILLINIVGFAMLEKYTAIVRRDAKLIEEKMQLEADTKMLTVASESMRDRLKSSEWVVQQDRLMRHDRRHFEALILSLLQNGNVDEAIKCLSERMKEEPRTGKKYCENVTVNAAISYYISKAEAQDINVITSLNIPYQLSVDDMELAIVICNLIENAIHACGKISQENRYIRLTAMYKRQLLFELENSCDGIIEFNENGEPVTNEENHGIGIGSVRLFVEKTGGTINYRLDEDKFKVRMIIEA